MYFVPQTYDHLSPLGCKTRGHHLGRVKTEVSSGCEKKTLNPSFLSSKGMSRCKVIKKKVLKENATERPVPSPSPRSKIETLLKPGDGGEEMQKNP